MVDFSKKIINSNKFRQPAIQFMETGSYCLYPKGTSEYFSFWETEMDRCINGFTADDGDYITGYNYFYLQTVLVLILALSYHCPYSGHRDYHIYF
jgi:hypothetical protein